MFEPYWAVLLVVLATLAIGAVAGMLWMQRYRRIENRLLHCVNTNNVQEMEVREIGFRLRVRRHTQPPTVVHVMPTHNLPPPALQPCAIADGESVVMTETEILYFKPEYPERGIAIPRFVEYLTGRQAQAERVRAEVIPVLAPVTGYWRPADIDRKTHVGYHPLQVPHRWDRKRYRNPYNDEFVMAGDLLGILIDVTNTKIVTEVRAPVTGYLTHIGAYEKTVLTAGAIVYLMTTLGEPSELRSEDVGTFYFPKVHGISTPPILGVSLAAGTVLGTRRALTVNSHITAPTNLQLVRCYVENGKTIQHGSLLFHYFPKTPA